MSKQEFTEEEREAITNVVSGCMMDHTSCMVRDWADFYYKFHPKELKEMVNDLREEND